MSEQTLARGRFVVFEGGEGAGKSTQARRLVSWLAACGYDVRTTREPGATPLGARIRELLLEPAGDPPSPRAEALLYAADRAHHVSTVIRPALAEGAVVVCDRYVDSSLAYQGAGRALPADEIAWLSQWATAGLRPDLVILLDVDPRLGMARIGDRGAADRLESESAEFHARVRQAFGELAAAEPRRYLVLDAALSTDELAARIRDRITPLLPPAPAPPVTESRAAGRSEVAQ
ncbi:MAG TPA: dTMP kinase [Cryptosporangiaceae bacterium]|nr:dTMP kinase [Cryptosporangiaceae bacterium]